MILQRPQSCKLLVLFGGAPCQLQVSGVMFRVPPMLRMTQLQQRVPPNHHEFMSCPFFHLCRRLIRGIGTLGIQGLRRLAGSKLRSLLPERILGGREKHLSTIVTGILVILVAVKELKLSYHNGYIIVNNRVSPI